MSRSVLFWRRTDVAGLERLELLVEPGGVRASSTVLCLESGGFRLDHHWLLTPDWRAQSVTVERWNAQGHSTLRLERDGPGWRVDGVARPDLEGAEAAGCAMSISGCHGASRLTWWSTRTDWC